jgi:hypothetical protein
MAGEAAFPAEVLARWREEPEVRVETSRGPDAPVHRTIIWIVVDDAGRTLIRSVRGSKARWYREAMATGQGAIHTRNERVPVAFEPARDADRVESCSSELERKYAGDPGVVPMLKSDILDTTLELRPFGAETGR